MYFANPHNPTGRVWSEDELKQLGQIMVDNDGSSQMKFTATLNVTVKHMYLLLKQCQITIRLLPQCLKVRHLI